jgi:hypothetical protein
MGNFADLVIRVLKDPGFAAQFHDLKTRDSALRSLGINPDHPGLRDALDKIDYGPLRRVIEILDPANVNKQN